MTDQITPSSAITPQKASGELRARRRTFTAAEKLRILRGAERCPQSELGTTQRRCEAPFRDR